MHKIRIISEQSCLLRSLYSLLSVLEYFQMSIISDKQEKKLLTLERIL
jgi:hypothetical protein